MKSLYLRNSFEDFVANPVQWMDSNICLTTVQKEVNDNWEALLPIAEKVFRLGRNQERFADYDSMAELTLICIRVCVNQRVQLALQHRPALLKYFGVVGSLIRHVGLAKQF